MKEKKAEKQGGKGKKIAVILLIVVLAVGCGFGGYLVASKKAAKKGPKNTAINTNGMAGNMMIEETPYLLGEFLVNLKDQDSKRYMKANIYIAYPKQSKDLAKELDQKKPILRDAVNLQLHGKKSTELLEVKGIEKLKKELTSKMNTQLMNGQITNVYFDNIIVQ